MTRWSGHAPGQMLELSVIDLSVIEWPILVSAALAGFLGSGHCVLMCGAISESLNRASNGLASNGLASKSLASSTLAKINPATKLRACGTRCGGSITQNLSRIAGYALMGALVGGLGNGALHAARALELRAFAQIASGLIMILIGATLLFERKAFASLERPGLKLLPYLIKLRNRLPKRAGLTRDIAAGLLWSLMPCGMVYAALSAAWLSVSALQGGLMMLCFGMGTLPALLGLSHILLRLERAPRLKRSAGALVLLLGVLSLGYASGMDNHHTAAAFIRGCLPAF